MTKPTSVRTAPVRAGDSSRPSTTAGTRAAGRRLRGLAAGASIVALAVAAGAAPAIAQTVDWIGTTDDWFDGGNWSSGVEPALGNTARIAAGVAAPTVINGGSAEVDEVQIGGAGVPLADDNGHLTVTGGATVTLNGFTTVGMQAIAGDSTLTITGGSTWNGSHVQVGRSTFGTGLLNILDGSTMVSGEVQIGAISQAFGEVLVDGSGTNWTATRISVGNNSNSEGILTVSGGGQVILSNPGTANFEVGEFGGSRGTVLLTGIGTSLTGSTSAPQLSRVNVGSGTGSIGVMTVEAGASVSVNELVIGRQMLADGTVTVTGAGTEWHNANTAVVANIGIGRLTIADGARMTAANGVTVASDAVSTGTLRLEGTAGARGVLETSQVSAGAGIPDMDFDGGILRLTGNQATLFSGFVDGEVDFLAGGAFIDTQGFFGGIDVDLEGPGGLTKLGTGSLGLRGDNTFAGGLHVLGGMVTFTDVENLGAVAGGITLDNGTLSKTSFGGDDLMHDIVLGAGGGTVIADPGSIDIRGDISGVGGLITEGSVALRGNNTYQGVTHVRAGRLDALNAGNPIPDASELRIAAGALVVVHGNETIGSLSGEGIIDGDLMTLTIAGAQDAEFGGVIQDGALSGFPMSLVKAGGGHQTLSSVNTYVGPTTVSGGILEIAAGGSIVSTTTVTAGGFVVNGTAGIVAVDGGFLGGVGTVNATTIGAGGTLAPGNSIGTLTVRDNLTFAAGSTYAVEVSPTDADRTNVVAGLVGPGDADLSGATVATVFVPGAYVDKEYVILNAEGGLGGTEFAGLSGTAPFGMEQSLAYDANNAYLVIETIYSQSPSLDLNRNQRAVANSINGYFDANNGIPGAFVGLLPWQLTQVSGEIAIGAMGAGFDASNQFLEVIATSGTGGAGVASAPLGYASDDALALSSSHAVDNAFATRWHLWGAAYGGGEKVEGDATVIGSADFSARTWGLASGITRNFDGGRIGLALGGAGTSFSLAGGLGSGNATSFNAGLHGTGYFGDGYVSAALAYGYHATRTSRAVPGDTLSARFGAQTFGGRLEAGYRLNLGGVALTPFAAAEATAYRLPGYTETSALGGPFALAYASQTETAIRTELGARTAITLGSNARLTGRAAWVWNADSARTVTAAFQALPGASFTINGAQPARHAALLEAGVEAAFGNVTAKLTATGEFSKNVTSFGAQAKVGFSW
ncbi:MAG: autotransporter domain-containing protein [Rhizobiaceae bacterium]